MQESQDEETYVVIYDRGKIALSYLLDTSSYLRQLNWTYKVYKSTPALIDKSGGSSRQYVGQRFDPDSFDLVEGGWTHDHCEICFIAISDKEGYGETDGYISENGDWICKECHELFIKPDDVQETIKSLVNSVN